MKSKNAQITVFIIVGIVLLIGVSTFLMLRDSSVRDRFEEGSQRVVVEQVASDFRPVQEFITTCLRDVAKEGVRRVGLHGGYVYPEELNADRFNPTSSNVNSIYFWPGLDDYKVAYWWHMSSEDTCLRTNTCRFSSHRPELTGTSNSIEKQLEKYIENEIDKCINDFSYLTRQGFDIDKDRPIVDVTIASDDVFVELKMTTQAIFGNREQTLTVYRTRLDVDLADIYKMASLISGFQADNAFLELQLLELIALYSGTSSNSMFPPTFEPNANQIGGNLRQIWTRTEIRSNLMSVLASYIPMITVYESLNFAPKSFDNDFDSAFFTGMMVSLGVDDEFGSRYNVDFNYRNWWDVYLSIGNSELVQAEALKIPYLSDLQPLGTFLDQALPVRYSFGYDVSYPVMVTLRNPFAFEGDGFTFQFALESNVRNNMPVFVSEGDPIDVNLPGSFFQSVFCNRDNFNSGDIKIDVRDASTGQQIPGVSIDYKCASEFCSIGLTKEQDDGIYFEGKFPPCAGGVLEVSALGYESRLFPLSTELNQGFEFPDIIELNPFYEVKVRAEVVGLMKRSDGSWSFDWNTKQLREGESVVLGFKKVATGQFDTEHSAIAFLEGPGSYANVELIPGEYEVFGQLILDTDANPNIDEVLIPAETISTPGILGIGSQEIDFDEIRFGPIFPQGMLFLDDDHGGTWEISSGELDSHDTITFKIIASPYITPGIRLNYDDLNEFGKADFYSREYRNQLNPCLGDGC